MTITLSNISEFTAPDMQALKPNTGDTDRFVTVTSQRVDAHDTALQNLTAIVNQVIALREEIQAQLNNMNNTIGAQPNVADHHGTCLTWGGSVDGAISGYGDNSATYTASSLRLLRSINGSGIVTPTELERWVYDSVDYGGTEAANPATAKAFAEKMGAASRYLQPFAVSTFATGTGTGGINYNGMYKFFHTNAISQIAANGRASGSFYIQCTDNDMYVFGSALGFWRQAYVNGARISNDTGESGGNWHRLTQGEIYHVAFSATLPDDMAISGNLIDIVAPASSNINIALPWIAHGDFQMPQHIRPVRSYGTVGNI